MLQIKNTTPFTTNLLLLPDATGVDTLFGVVKGTFVIGPHPVPASEQVPVVMADQHYDEPRTSSIRAVSDVCLGKPGTDVVLVGSAYAPNAQPAWQMDVGLRVGPLSKTVRVFGDRIWESNGAGARVAWVAPFVRVPLVWERAFGGSDETEKGPRAEPRNPVGMGFYAPGGAKQLHGMPLPNVENPNTLISSPSDAPEPAGFAPIAPHWEPRKAFAGTYDDQWQRTRAPYLPTDFDERFFNFAPAGLFSPRPFEGGETVEIRGVTPDGSLRFSLPTVRVELTFRRERDEETRPAVLDTVIIEPDDGRLVLVWRAALTCDKQALKIREVRTSLSSA